MFLFSTNANIEAKNQNVPFCLTLLSDFNSLNIQVNGNLRFDFEG